MQNLSSPIKISSFYDLMIFSQNGVLCIPIPSHPMQLVQCTGTAQFSDIFHTCHVMHHPIITHLSLPPTFTLLIFTIYTIYTFYGGKLGILPADCLGLVLLLPHTYIYKGKCCFSDLSHKWLNPVIHILWDAINLE